MRTLVSLMAIGLALVVACKKTSAEPKRIPWRNDIEAAFADAKRENKRVIVWADADWDTAHALLERETFSDPRVQRLLDDFVPIYVDGTDTDDPTVEARVRTLHIVGVPSIIIYERDRKELARIYSYLPPEKLIPVLEDARRGKTSPTYAPQAPY